MGSGTFKKHLIHRATFLAGSASRTSSGEVTWTWTPISNGACGTVVGRLVHKKHAVASDQGFMMGHEVLWLCDSSESVEEEHRVRNVAYTDGSSVQEAAGTWRVERLIPVRRRTLHHYELTLEKVE